MPAPLATVSVLITGNLSNATVTRCKYDDQNCFGFVFLGAEQPQPRESALIPPQSLSIYARNGVPSLERLAFDAGNRNGFTFRH
eukprot:IDg3581t1